jgi:SAM-dependent methyltransferase
MAGRSATHWLGSQLAHPAGLGGWIVGQAMRAVNREPIRLAIDALDVGPADIALDLGCGPGAGVGLLARLATHVHGVDASETMLATARRANRPAIAAGQVTLALGTFESIPLPDRSIDRILAANVAYFWTDMGAVVSEVRRISKPGGRMVLYLTDASTMQDWPFADHRTHRHFDEISLQRALTDAGIMQSNISVSRHALNGGVAGLVCTIEIEPAGDAVATEPTR